MPKGISRRLLNGQRRFNEYISSLYKAGNVWSHTISSQRANCKRKKGPNTRAQEGLVPKCLSLPGQAEAGDAAGAIGAVLQGDGAAVAFGDLAAQHQADA